MKVDYKARWDLNIGDWVLVTSGIHKGKTGRITRISYKKANADVSIDKCPYYTTAHKKHIEKITTEAHPELFI